MQFNYQAFLALSILLGLANADASTFVSNLQTLVTDAQNTNKAVVAFEASQGLLGALDIQTGSTQFSKDLTAAINAAQGVDSSASSEVAAAFKNLGGPVTDLITNLIAKSGDFSTVGASSLVVQNLNSMQASSGKLLAAVYGIVQCGPDGDTAGSVGSAIYTKFLSADDTFSASTVAVVASSCQPGAYTAATGSSAAPTSGGSPTSAASSSGGSPTSAASSNGGSPTSAASSNGGSPTSAASSNGGSPTSAASSGAPSSLSAPTGSNDITTVYTTTEDVVTDCSTSPYQQTTTIFRTITKTDCECEKPTSVPVVPSPPPEAPSVPVVSAPPTQSAPPPVAAGAPQIAVNAGAGIIAIGASAFLL